MQLAQAGKPAFLAHKAVQLGAHGLAIQLAAVVVGHPGFAQRAVRAHRRLDPDICHAVIFLPAHIHKGGVYAEARQNEAGRDRLVHRREAERAPELPAVLHREIVGEGPPKQAVCLLDLALRDERSDPRAAHRLSGQQHRLLHRDGEAQLIPKPHQILHRARAIFSEMEVKAAAHPFGAAYAHQHLAHKALRLHLPDE